MQFVAEIAKPCVGNKVLFGRSKNDVVKNPVNINKYEDSNDNQHEGRPEKVPAQYFEMIHKAHLGVWILNALAPDLFEKCLSF